MAEPFPEEVKRFILEHMTSLDQLETLLLLRTDPNKEWTAGEVSRQLYTRPEVAAARLADLASRRLLIITNEEPRYQYAPSEETAQLIDRLDHLYKMRRVTVINLLYSKSIEGVQAFADAFQLRKEKN